MPGPGAHAPAHERQLLDWWTEMMKLTLPLALLVTASAGAAAAQTQESFDNPGIGSVPCVVLKQYDTGQAKVGGELHYRATASLENICGRSLEVRFCFVYAEAVDEVDRSCYGTVLRPWASAEAKLADVGSRIVATEYQWRFIPVGETPPGS